MSTHLLRSLLVTGLWLLGTAGAHAEGGFCPPGTIDHNNGMAPAIVCSPIPGYGNQQAPQALVSIYAAIAWHPDAADIWVDGNYTGPNAAERGALEMCNQVMGGGCTSTGEWSNSAMLVIRDRRGSFYNAWAGDGNSERRRVLAECSAKQLLPCEVFATIRSNTSRRSPSASARKFYAASAWIDGEGYDHKLYVASGFRTADAASAAAVKACSDATSRPCKTYMWTGNGFIQAYRLNRTDDSATVETTAKRAQEAVRLNCKKLKSATCELQALFDSRKPGLFVHDFTKTKAR